MSTPDPRGGTLSDDLQYPACPDCQTNANGLFTQQTCNKIADWHCVKCGAVFDADGEIVAHWESTTVSEATTKWVRPR